MSTEVLTTAPPECPRVKVERDGSVKQCWRPTGHTDPCQPRFWAPRAPRRGDIDMATGQPVLMRCPSCEARTHE